MIAGFESDPGVTTNSPPWARFAGLRVIGDVHGEAETFRAAIEDAAAKDLFVIQLGDLVDRGPDSPGALRLAMDLKDRGVGLAIRGNHDDKLYRALKGHDVRIGVDLGHTIEAIRAAPDHESLMARFLDAFETTPWWLHIGRWFFVHGAFHPGMLTAPGPEEVKPGRVRDKCKWLALRGEGKTSDEETLPTRTYDWIDTVPADLTVLIGHDMVAEDRIEERVGALGGRVLFCDTGCGKRGRLSWVDLSLRE